MTNKEIVTEFIDKVFNWTMFDPEHKKERHDAIFVFRLEEAKTAGKRMAER